MGQGGAVEGEADGVEGADGSSSRGFEDGADIGIEAGAPFGSEAVGDLSEDDARPQRLTWSRGVTGRINSVSSIAAGENWSYGGACPRA